MSVDAASWAPPRAGRALTWLHGRELVRDRRYFVFALMFPFLMLGIFLVIGALVPQGPSTPDFTQTVVPMALFLAITGSSLTVTAAPLAGLRERGVLRLLGTTPVRRRQLLHGFLLVRLAMVATQALVLLVIALVVHAVSPARLPALLGVTLLGMAMFLAVGCLLGGRLASADVAGNLATLIQLATLFLSGLAIPLWLLPDAVARALGLLPSTFLADLLLGQMRAGHAQHTPWLSVLVVLITTAVLSMLAVRSFRWDLDES